jgi:exosome complex component RRP42
LKIAKLPKYDLENNKVLHEEPDKAMPLTDKNLIPVTVHKIGEHLIVDPTREEEDVSKTRITIGTSDGVISSIQKGEAGVWELDEIMKAVEMSKKCWGELFKKLKAQIK